MVGSAPVPAGVVDSWARNPPIVGHGTNAGGVGDAARGAGRAADGVGDGHASRGEARRLSFVAMPGMAAAGGAGMENAAMVAAATADIHLGVMRQILTAMKDSSP
jgi:hypothetical protein